MAEERNVQDEKEAAAAISQALIMLIVVGLVAATVSAVLSAGISRSITTPLGKTARVAMGVAEGKLDIMTSR
jgi:HAMP domain-containing protein